MNKIMTVAFSPSQEMWSIKDFRDLISEISKDPETELYLITTNTDTDFISDVIREGGIDPANYYLVADNTALISQLSQLKILIFMSDDIELNTAVDTAIPIVLAQDNVTGCQSILSNTIIDVNKLQFKYLTKLRFWTDQIKKYW